MTTTNDVIERAANEERLIQQAVQMQQSGDLPRADLVYQQILKQNPRHADALNLRGLLAYQAGKIDSALTLIKAALKIAPKNGQYFANLAFMQDLNGDAAAAERSFKKAVKYQPDHAEAWNNYATFLQNQERIDEAENAYCTAIEKAPDYLQAYYNLGVMLINYGAYEKAASIFEQAVAKMPNNPDLLLHLGVALQGGGNLKAAVSAYEKILDVTPEHPSALVNLASVAMAEDKMMDVLDYSKRAIAVAPDNAGAWNNLGNAYLGLSDYELAESAYKRVLELIPDEADVYGSLATVYKKTERLSESETYYRKALELSPNDPRHAFQLSLLLQTIGKFDEAWPLYEAGFACGERFPDYRLSTPRWQGQKLGEDECLHIWGEQGIGDEIHLAGMISDAMTLAPNCIIECAPRLVALFARSFPNAKVVTTGKVMEGEAKYQIPMGGLFEYTNGESLGYLIPDPEACEKWKARLAELRTGIKVGIAWGSELKTPRRLSALTDLSDWSSILAVPGVEFVNLQYGDCEDELLQAEKKNNLQIQRWPDMDLKNDLDDLVALMANLDLVITIGISVFRIARGAGCDCWVLTRDKRAVIPTTNSSVVGNNQKVFAAPYDAKWQPTLNAVAVALQETINR